jgi:hypothetical protein
MATETATRGGTLLDLPYAWEGDFAQSVDRALGAMAPSSVKHAA